MAKNIGIYVWGVSFRENFTLDSLTTTQFDISFRTLKFFNLDLELLIAINLPHWTIFSVKTFKKTKLPFNFIFMKKMEKKKEKKSHNVTQPCDFFLVIYIFLIVNLKLSVNLNFFKKKIMDINVIVSFLTF